MGVGDLGFVPAKMVATLSSGSFRQIALHYFRLSLSKRAAPIQPVCRSSCLIEAELHRSGGAGARPPLGMSPIRGGEAPTSAGAERRTRWLALQQSPSLQRKGTAGP